MLIQSNYIIQKESAIICYNDDNCIIAKETYQNLLDDVGCTYLLYMYENLRSNKKHIYSSNWDWQNYLIGKRLINSCPIFLTGFKYLEKRGSGHIFMRWLDAPPRNKEERNVCGLRADLNIANGFGYAAVGNGIRETLAFGGNVNDTSFYKHFIADLSIFSNTLQKMRNVILYKEHSKKLILDCMSTNTRN